MTDPLTKTGPSGSIRKRNVVTISRQMGSLGCDVARAAAQLLGYQIVYRELINEAARRTGCPDVALIAIDELNLLGLRPATKALRDYTQSMRQVMEEFASTGNIIIIGRAGQTILAQHENVLHVRIIAPFEVRAARIAERHNVSLEGAASQLEASDRYRQRYLKRFYQINWNNPDLYDLMINTARITPAEAAHIIQEALLQPSLHTLNPESPSQENLIGRVKPS